MGKLIHGYSKHPLYKIWKTMKQRCYNENYPRYKDWGGRGITVCDEWMNPKVFVEWCLENGWKPGLQIDRKNNNGNYIPNNCWFVAHKENNHNKRLLMSTNKSGYRGVSWNKRDKKWISEISINNIGKHIGSFDSPISAALAYNAAIPDNRIRNFK